MGYIGSNEGSFSIQRGHKQKKSRASPSKICPDNKPILCLLLGFVYPKKSKSIQTKRPHNGAGLNFINILCTAITHADPKSVKRY